MADDIAGLVERYSRLDKPGRVALLHSLPIELAESVVHACRARAERERTQLESVDETHGPAWPIGVSQGRLASRGHVSPIARGQRVTAGIETLYGGTLVLGPMGSGKTRAGLQPFAAHFLRWPGAGLFAYGVKPNWSAMLVRIGQWAGKRPNQIHVVGPGHQPWPLLRGLQPESVGTFARAAFRIGPHRSGDPFFESAAANAIARAAQIVYYAVAIGTPLCVAQAEADDPVSLGYDLRSIAQIIHAAAEQESWKPFRRAIEERIADLRIGKRNDDADALDESMRSLVRMLVGKAERTVSSVIMTVDSIIEPFLTSRPLREAFSDGSGSIDIGQWLDAGDVVILDVDLARYSTAARLVYLLAFEQMRTWMLRRVERIQRGATLNPVAFVADEYAEVAVAEHKRMWRLCREACIAPAVAYQLHSDLRATVGGSDDADALVAGFATKILFRTDDHATVDLWQRALANAEVQRSSSTASNQNSSGWNTHAGGAGQSGGDTNSSSSSTSWVERVVINAQLVQSLRSDIRREIPVNKQTAEVVTITNDPCGRRVADILTVAAWDPPMLKTVEGPSR